MALSTYNQTTKLFFEDVGDTLRLTVDDMNVSRAEQIPATGVLLAPSGTAGIAMTIQGGVDGQGLVMSNGVPTWTTLASGVAYTGTAPISVANGVFSVAVATSNAVGVVRPGAGLAVDGAGVLSVTVVGGVSSFNARSGAINLTLGDVTNVTGTGQSATNALGLGSATTKAATGSGGSVPTLNGLFTAGHIAVFADSSGMLQDGGALGAGVDPGNTITIDGSAIPGSAGSPYTMAARDFLVFVNKTTGAGTSLVLPASPVAGRNYEIIDAKGDAGTNNIVVSANAGWTLNGASSLTLPDNYSTLVIKACPGNAWRIL